MDNAGLTLMVLVGFQLCTASSQDMLGWYSIDCGNNFPRIGNNLIQWTVDGDYTQAGMNRQAPGNQPLVEMNTLRIFPNTSQKNCYMVPAYQQTLRYIIRAGFFYGNYDNLDRAPTFDLMIDGVKWATVDNSRPTYHEAIYVTHGTGYFNVCLVETREGEVPFISLIEVVPLWVNLYRYMENNATFHLVTRTNFGGNEIRFTGFLSDEKYNRIWTSGSTPSDCIDIDSFPDYFSEIENDPPRGMFSRSIQSNGSNPITLDIDFPQLTPQPAYFVFYFAESAPRNPNQKRIMEIKINGQHEKIVESPGFGKCRAVTLYPVTIVGPILEVGVGPANGSTLPPLIAGMEVFTRTDLSGGHGVNSSLKGSQYFLFVHLLVNIICQIILQR